MYSYDKNKVGIGSVNYGNLFTTLVLLIILVIYAWIITEGTGKFFVGDGTLINGAPYDSLAENLLKGTSEVDPRAILWEGFARDNKTYMYFGPFPALLRIIPGLLLPNFYGNWARLSCIIASLLCLLAFSQIISKQLQSNQNLSPNLKRFITNISLLSFGLGSPLIFSVTTSEIYFEAILWALCWGLWGIFFTIMILSKEFKLIYILGLSFSAGFALLSKVTFSIPLYLVLLIVLICFIKKHLKEIIIYSSPAVLCLGFQLWYNYDRFGSIYKFYDNEYYIYFENRSKIINNFNIQRIPFTLNAYLGLNNKYLVNKSPSTTRTYTEKNKIDLFFDLKNVTSLLVTSPWLIIGAILGLFTLVMNKNYLQLFGGIAFLSNIVIILCFHSIYQRYTAEFIPFTSFMFSYFLLNLGKGRIFKYTKLPIIVCISFLCIFSIITTTLTELEYCINSRKNKDFKIQLINIKSILEKRKLIWRH